MYWNQCGSNVLLMTNTEVDKTGASYYGKQTLHHLNTKGETAMVMLSKSKLNYCFSISIENLEQTRLILKQYVTEILLIR